MLDHLDCLVNDYVIWYARVWTVDIICNCAKFNQFNSGTSAQTFLNSTTPAEPANGAPTAETKRQQMNRSSPESNDCCDCVMMFPKVNRQMRMIIF